MTWMSVKQSVGFIGGGVISSLCYPAIYSTQYFWFVGKLEFFIWLCLSAFQIWGSVSQGCYALPGSLGYGQSQEPRPGYISHMPPLLIGSSSWRRSHMEERSFVACSVGFSLVDTDYFKSNFPVLAGVAWLVETSSHTLKCGFSPWLWHILKATNRCFFPSPLALKKPQNNERCPQVTIKKNNFPDLPLL